MDIAVPLTHNLPKTETEYYEIWKHDFGSQKYLEVNQRIFLSLSHLSGRSVHQKYLEVNQRISISLSHLSGRSVHQKLPKISTEYKFNQKRLKSGTKSSTDTNMSYCMQIPSTRPLTLGDRMNFLPLMEPNLTDRLGLMKVCQQIDAEKCGYVIVRTTTAMDLQ